MSSGSIAADRVTKAYGEAPPSVLDLSFQYEGAGAIGFLGPNGAGKTTTLKLLVGLLRPTRGSVRLNGFDPVRDRRRALWDVGALVETPEPYPTLRVHEALDLVGRARGLGTADIDREIDRTHLLLHLPPLDRRVGSLSKGQRQRVVLAAALLGDPPVLLLDEPTSGLDPAERVLVRDVLRRLKRDHLILMSSHQMVEVSEVCDRLLFLDRGRRVLEDDAHAVAERFGAGRVEVEFAAAVDRGRLAPVADLVVEATALSATRWRLRFDPRGLARERLLSACQSVAPVVEFAPGALALEDAYLEVVPTASEST